jgi:glycosyltransferase involved in cell wall biosynthesis
MLSIIIPTLNEEKNLGNLLQDIQEQTWTDYEIIISDGNSNDKTIEIAQRYGCKFFIEKDNNRRHPSIQRNNGAKIAKGNLFLFLDADTRLPNKYFLEKTITEFNFRKLAISGFYLNFDSKKFFYKFYRKVYNGTAKIAQHIKPLALGAGIISKKEIHDQIGGFDETIFVGEDQVYCERGAKLGKFRLIKSTNIFFSIRRFEKYGPWKMFFQIVYSTIYVLIFGPIKKKIVKYDFGNFD